MNDKIVEYHSARAMAELDMALSASSPDAARAHFRLSSLHLEKSRALGGALRLMESNPQV
jgi:hypothetical protein